MDRAQYLNLMKQHDDHTHWERPGGWNTSAYYAAERKFLALAKELQQVLGERLTVEYGSQIQDASFHGLFAVPKSCLLHDDTVSLRVSNFASLATLYDADESVAPGCLDKVKDMLKRHGYTYLPSWILREPYSDPIDINIPTWGVRYFDYF